MKYLLSLLFFQVILLNVLEAQYTAIPDAKFEQALIDLGIDKGSLDGKVLTNTIKSITSLNIINKNITDLTGIQDFTKLSSLNCSFNKLLSLNISKNTDLETLNINSNRISTISFSANKNLKNLYCSDNKFSSLDINANNSLLVFDCSNNQLATLQINNNINLQKLVCSGNRLDNLNLSTNKAIYFLNCSNNAIKNLDISNLTSLKTFFCAGNQLKGINVSANDSLDFFNCSDNQISAINLTSSRLLANLNVSANQLSNIDLSKNDSLKTMDCSTNQIKAIDLSSNLELNTLSISSNQLQSLDLSKNNKLAKLDCSKNLIATLNFNSDTSLTSIDCSTNQLINISIQNSKNQKITLFDATKNPDLRCIKVDNASNSNSDGNWKKDSTAKFTQTCITYTYVPDDNFETALSAYDDISNDNYIPTANILNVKYLNLSNLGISDLTGIQDFVNLDSLDCSKNKLSNLDMSFQPNLVKLNCDSNNLFSLKIVNNSNSLLTKLNTSGNPLLSCIEVDDTIKAKTESNWIKDSTAVYSINCRVNQSYIPDIHFEQALIDLGHDKGSIDHYVNTDSIKSIKILDISNKNIFDLTGISNFVALDSLNCSGNNLDTLFVDSLKNLKSLSCFGNYLSKINLSKNTQLLKLSCGSNNLDSIDISSDTLLVELNCDANSLNQLNLSQNPLLEKLNCNSNKITNNGLDLSQQTILKKIFCANNQLSNINFTNNKILETIDCSNNELLSIDLDSNSRITNLNCSQNSLTNLNLSADTLLKELNCSSNQIGSINLTKSILLENLYSQDNSLTTLDLTKNDSLRKLFLANNQLSQLDLSNNLLLNNLDINNNLLNSIDLSRNDSLEIVGLNSNNIKVLNTDSNLVLQELSCENNQLDSLKISTNVVLTNLKCSNNNLKKIDLSTLVKLQKLSIDKNQLNELLLDNNTDLTQISCAENYIKTLNFSNNTKLTTISCNSDSLTSLILKNSNNNQLTNLNASNNPELFCIEIDNENAINSDWSKDSQAKFAEFCHYNETYIPDSNFEASISSIIGETSNNKDHYIPTDSIAKLQTLAVNNKGISDLTGIQDFKALKNIYLQNNSIDTLILSENSTLVTVNCANNIIDSLDLSQNINLQSLNISNNQLKNVDLSPFDKLQILEANNNRLENLNLNANIALTSLNLSNNKLLSLVLKNGNNDSLSLFNTTNNPNLSCIEVDNPTKANSGTGNYANWQKDNTASFNANCHYNQSYIPDNAFEQSLIDMGYDNTGLDDYVPTKKISPITYLDLSNKSIHSLKGIADFTNLVTLIANNNNVDTADFNFNIHLQTLNLSQNQLADIKISNDSVLQDLNLSKNKLAFISIDSNKLLKQLDVSFNELTSISIIDNTNLQAVNCSNNLLYSVDANNGANDKLKNFDLRNNPDLRCILIDDINAAKTQSGWYKDETADYKLICDDDDNDGIADADDLCPTTPPGDFVDLFGCTIFSLPTNNFTITSYSETCRDGNNGIISISAQKIMNYHLSLISTFDTISHDFSENIAIKNLRADYYNLCITVPEHPDYEQCYQLKITQPDSLGVYTSVDTTKKQISLKMTGSTKYIINFNGSEFSTTQNNINLSLKKGENTLIVKTELNCQGIFRKKIILADKATVYPNPIKDELKIYLNEPDITNAKLKIYSTLGLQILNSNFPVSNGLIRINTSSFRSGIYYISISAENYHSNFKVIKK